MHQHPRPSPVTASPANSPRTNPIRTNNPREELSSESRPSSGRDTPSEQGIGIGEGADAMLRDPESGSQNKDSMAKLNQVIQNYFTKFALTVLDSRVSLPQAYSKDSVKRVNKWFNVEINETDILRDDLRLWKSCDSISNRPPPMIIELYIDTQDITNNQSLVIVDEQGRRWDVEEALNKSSSSSGGTIGQSPRSEVVVERWVVQLGESTGDIPYDLSTNNPRIYKNTIVLLRSLYSISRLLPAWKIGRRPSKTGSAPKSPKLRWRITQGPQSEKETKKNDQLAIPLFKSGDDVLGTFVFDPIDSPAGPLCLQVTYRNHCDFRVDYSEAFLSSRFMGMDEQYFEPSLGRKEDANKQRKDYGVRPTTEVGGSLPHDRRDIIPRPDQGQAYGSMSTFHQPGPRASSSPLSALRAARIAGSESPEDTVSGRAPPNMRSAQGSRLSLRSADGGPRVDRRPSVSFMPFKSPSLSASPSQAEQPMTSVPRGSLGKTSPLAALAEARAPSALGPYGSVPSRGSPNAADIPSSISSSPKPGPPQRYSSSFGHRKAKVSLGGGSRTDDDNSSGKASLTSSNAQPGSGVLAEGGGASSGSIQTDDDNISDFLKLLNQKKDLKSFRHPNDQAATEASTRRTSAALNKFQRMRDSNDALYSSMSSSHLLHRSSASSSRQLSSVPPVVAGTSVSPSSSPGKPISPHTPHTPAVPSRLSANSTIEYPRRVPSQDEDRRPRSAATDGARDARTNRDSSTGAIDIPNSPRPFHPNYRRSSSAAQQARNTPYEEDDIFPFGMRSTSLNVDDRQPVSLGGLAGMHEGDAPEESAVAEPSVETQESAFGSRFDAERSNRPQPSSFERREEGGSLQSRVAPYRPRIGRGSGRGTPIQASSSSLAERGSGSGSLDHRGSRSSFPRPPSNFEDEEPLLFAMSDFGATQQPHRSPEENRGGERGGSDSGASSRKGSRRGGY